MEDPFGRKDRDPLEVGHPIVALLREDLKAGPPAGQLITALREAELALLDADTHAGGERPRVQQELVETRDDARNKLYKRLIHLERYFEAHENLQDRIQSELAKNPNGPQARELYDEFLARHSIRPSDTPEPVVKRRRRLLAYYEELEQRCPVELGRLIRREISSNDFSDDIVWEAASAALAAEGRAEMSDEGVISAIQDAVGEMFLKVSLPVPRGDSPSTKSSLKAAHRK